MKKLLLLLIILLFPIIMLAFWVYWGLQHANKQPNPPPVTQTNQSAAPPAH